MKDQEKKTLEDLSQQEICELEEWLSKIYSPEPWWTYIGEEYEDND